MLAGENVGLTNSSSQQAPVRQLDSDLLRLPVEILHRILLFLGVDDPSELARVVLVCRFLHAFIYSDNDSSLWRDILLRRYDDPHEAAAFTTVQTDINWRERVEDRALTERIFHARGDEDYSTQYPSWLIQMLPLGLMGLYLDMPARTPTPQGDNYDPLHFSDTPETRNGPVLDSTLLTEAFHDWHINLLRQELVPAVLRDLPHRRRTQPRDPTSILTKVARLHALHPASDHLGPDEYLLPRRNELRGYVRSIVYSRRNFRSDNDWAPLHTDGTVDWLLVDAIGTAMMRNGMDLLEMGDPEWACVFEPLNGGIDATRGIGFNDISCPPKLNPGDVWDWAFVEGTWCGSYAFMDYCDWLALNEPAHLRLSIPRLNLSEYAEAIGDLMELKLTTCPSTKESDAAYSRLIGHSGQPLELPVLETPLPTSDLLPPIYFYGESRHRSSGMHHPPGVQASFTRGVVRMTSDSPPQIRWTICIRYGGEDRWRLEAVQVGGRDSDRGIFGVWTDAQKSLDSPNGPVWYWKDKNGFA